MKIAQAKVWSLDMALSRPYAIAGEYCDQVTNLFFKVTTDTGVTGVGAAAPEPSVTGESGAMCLAALQVTAERLAGRALDVEYLSQEVVACSAGCPAARCAVETALLDSECKAAGVPLVARFGQHHKALPTSVTVGIQPLDEALAQVREYLARGFRVLKLKTGEDVAHDVELTARVRELAPGASILVDANQGYSPSQLMRYTTATESFDVALIEQPLPAGQEAAMSRLPASTRKRCVADESLHSPQDARALAASPQGFGVFNIKLMKCGGVLAGREIAAVAQRHGIELMWGCMDESAISIAAALHGAFACPATRYLDLDGSLDLAEDAVEGGFVLADGVMRLTGEPGLGVRQMHG